MVKCNDCSKRAYFNFITEKTPIYCTNHKLVNMVDIKKKNVFYAVKNHIII